MKQKQFEAEHAELWRETEALLSDASLDVEPLPVYYRRLCQCLALAQQRGYSPTLTDYLRKMAFDCHARLYGTAVERPLRLRAWINRDLPRRVREEWRLLLVVTFCFWGVAGICGALVWWRPYLAYSFVGADTLNRFHAMYEPGLINIGRGNEGDLAAFGMYIWNNVSIAFRTFAGGLLACLFALFSLCFNGMFNGVLAAWISLDPVTRDNFWPFVATHSSFEIIGLMLAGLAGLRLGMSLLKPGRLSRRHAMFIAGRRMFPVLIGAAIFTVIAAFFEAFWCASSSVPPEFKYCSAAFCWTSLIAYFAFAGRGGGSEEDALHAA